MKIFTAFFLLFNSFLFSQSNNEYEFMGGLKLNGKDDQVISYKIVFSEKEGVISGYSITDLGGDYETKNVISGKYSSKTNSFQFREESIIYTKSKIKKESFCYVNYSGKLNLKSNNPKINDDFIGLYQNKSKCVNGIIQLVGTKSIYKLMNKVNNRIQKSKKIDAQTKEKVNPIKLLDSVNSNVLKSKQNLQMFTKDDKVTFEVHDAGVEDGDMINIYVDGKLFLENYVVMNKPKSFEIPIKNDSVIIEIEAVNEGEAPPNTSDILIKDSTNELKTITKLNKNNKTAIEIVKSE
jgi:hypothetical protein